MQQKIHDILGSSGRLISMSKGQYRHDNPDHVVVYNSNLCTSEGKIWYGDLDLTLEADKVKLLAKELNQTLYVLCESDARFENEKNPKLEKAVYTVLSTGEEFFDNSLYVVSDNKIVIKPSPEPTAEEQATRKKRIQEGYKQEDYEVVDLYLPDLASLKEEDPEEYQCFNTVDVSKFFEHITRDCCPLSNFQKWLQKDQNIDLEKEYNNYYVTKEVYEELNKITGMWAEVFHTGWLSEYKKEQSLAWHMFNFGPSHFMETPEWAEEGVLYKKIKK